MLPLILASVAFFAHVQASPDRATAAQPVFEIRLAKPLDWENGYLRVSLDLVNRSAKTLFLPSWGVYIESSACSLSSAPEKNGREEWISVFGASDIVKPLQVKPLAPGGMAHYDYSAASTLAVVDLGRELWREIPVRGSLRIEAQYYLADPTLLPNGTQEHGNSSVERWLTRRQPPPRVATLVATIPCPRTGCARGCDGPPSIVESESTVVPDIHQYDSEWVERGEARNIELRKLLPCAD